MPFDNLTHKDTEMNKLTATLFAACLAVGSVSAFAADEMKKDGMAKDSMAKDGMTKDSMAKDGMKKDEPWTEGRDEEGPMAKDGMEGFDGQGRHEEGRDEEVAATRNPGGGSGNSGRSTQGSKTDMKLHRTPVKCRDVSQSPRSRCSAARRCGMRCPRSQRRRPWSFRRRRRTGCRARRGIRNRRVRRRLLLGRAGRVPAREGRDATPCRATPAATQTPRKYEEVGSGRTGHAEAVRITYDPRQISYGKLLQIYFSVAHNPTELNRQGPDSGTQYRSAIFAANAEQARVAKAYIAQLDKAKVFGKPIATTIEPSKPFYPAEAYHQDYMTRNPTAALHRDQRPAQDRQPEARIPRPLSRRACAGGRYRHLAANSPRFKPKSLAFLRELCVSGDAP